MLAALMSLCERDSMVTSVKELYAALPDLRARAFKIMYDHEFSYQAVARQLKLNAWTVQRFFTDENIQPDIKTLTKIDKWVEEWEKETA